MHEHPSTKLESSRATDIDHRSNEPRMFLVPSFYTLTNLHPLDKNYQSDQTRSSISIYTTRIVPLPFLPRSIRRLRTGYACVPCFFFPLSSFSFLFFHQTPVRVHKTRTLSDPPLRAPPAGSLTRAPKTRGKRGARPGYEWKYVFNGSKVGIVAPSGVRGPSPVSRALSVCTEPPSHYKGKRVI